MSGGNYITRRPGFTKLTTEMFIVGNLIIVSLWGDVSTLITDKPNPRLYPLDEHPERIISSCGYLSMQGRTSTWIQMHFSLSIYKCMALL
jgi:hypothetical protein